MTKESEKKDIFLRQIISKLDEVIAVLHNTNAVPPLDIEFTLWDNTEVARYIGVSYKYANEYIVTHHTFPDAIRLPTKNGRSGHPRWYAKEIIQWVSKNRER